MNGHFLDSNGEFNICKHHQNKRTVVANFYPFITFVCEEILIYKLIFHKLVEKR